jgi:hypothetical protein
LSALALPTDDLDANLILRRQTSRLCPPEVIAGLKAGARRLSH